MVCFAFYLQSDCLLFDWLEMTGEVRTIGGKVKGFSAMHRPPHPPLFSLPLSLSIFFSLIWWFRLFFIFNLIVAWLERNGRKKEDV